MGDCKHDFESNEFSEYCAHGCGEKWAIYTIKQHSIKEREIIKYCSKHIDKMWAASICAIILDCDFRDTPEKLKDLGL